MALCGLTVPAPGRTKDLMLYLPRCTSGHTTSFTRCAQAAAAPGGIVSVANLGDCGIRVVRYGECNFASTVRRKTNVYLSVLAVISCRGVNTQGRESQSAGNPV